MGMKTRALGAVALVVAAAGVVTTATADVITSLPGLDALPSFKMRSGYVPLPGSSREVFYWLVDSERAPATDPLAIWFQGGPGCSGLIGLFEENGPFVVGRDQKLSPNPFSWNKFANMLFIEQPVGVGFSTDKSQSLDANFTSSDSGSSVDNYHMLQSFLRQFPEFQSRAIWFTGESYGGMYMPTLARQVIHGPDMQLRKQFKGMLLGNPVTYCKSAGLSNIGQDPMQFHRYFYNGLLSYTTLMEWKSAKCDSMATMTGQPLKTCTNLFKAATKSIGVVFQQLKAEGREVTAEQETMFLAATAQAVEVARADVDPDNLYQDFCTGNGTLDSSFGPVEDCKPMGDVLTSYLNNPAVQKAIHARVGIKWSSCSASLNYTSDFQQEGLIPVLEDVFVTAPHLHILYYSGDVDVATVPMMTTQACLHELAPRVKATSAWQPWTVNGWHAGYVESFDRYTFASVKGAGHEVPQYQPLTAFAMAQRWIEKQSLLEAQTARTKAISAPTQGSVLRETLAVARQLREAVASSVAEEVFVSVV